ncbi:matrix-remodeling-associated protein 5-like [Mugil cephalus]|uniref:matrix-remodeling-associated protein 5-like n=1 Tax=Mugil cephalus TaxID=48193 RepID=UPI001FB590A2|nr:matrix-remodeling-associated protein 5-like [Mugil cephalus]XP_047457965.1 matrix-remodeling-associated protein 5-like [Mugil cephalus]
MYRSVYVPAGLLAVLVFTLMVPRSQSCPRSCNCYQANEVHCTFRSLLTVPPGLPAHTRRINLGFNSINRLHDRSLAGLKKVELLMLHSNDLHHLPEGVFRDLKSLQILKLSYNKLREIASSLTFSGLTSLLRLYLDHNLLQHIHPRALLQLPSLRLLRLQGNRLHQLHPHTLCTLSLLNTYYFSTLRHLDLSNNSLATLPKDTLATAPLLETLVLHANPWSCDCRMNWFLSWTLAHPGLMKCPGGPQCPVCASPKSLQEQGLLEQTALLCTSPVIPSPGKETPWETEFSEIQSRETFREPLGTVSLALSDHQGNSVELSCNITSDSQDIAPPPDLSLSSSSPLPLALSLSLECPVERQSYEKLWRILAYYSETAVRLEREIMLSKAPALAYRYRQTAETDGFYHTGVKASVKAKPQWLLQSSISIQLNRAQSNGHKVQLIYSTRVSAHPDPASSLSASLPASPPWVLISTNHTAPSLAAVAGSKLELSCPLLSSGNPRVWWILPDGSKLSHSSSTDGRLRALASGLLIRKVKLSDAGIYYCVASAGRDVDVLPLRLTVEESSVPPSGEQVAPSISGTVGEPVSLPCKVSGSPEPYMSWILPDGNVIRRGLAVSGGLTIESNGSLSLPKLSQRDAGHYRCIAVNPYGSDSLSMQLILNSKHIPPLRNSFPRGPQSAAGRSTKIRAPLLREVDEGSGNGDEDEERTVVGNTKRPIQHQPHLNRRYPVGNPRRRGPVGEGPVRRGGAPVSSIDNRRNRFENRHRVTTNKQRLDPQKWADLLAKIRQKTGHTDDSQATTTVLPVGDKEKDTRGHERDNEAERGRAEVETEIEGSSVDDADLQEEELQPIQPVLTGTGTKANTGIHREIETDTERSTEKPSEIENETEQHIQTEKEGLQTETAANPTTQTEPITSNPTSGANEIALVGGGEGGTSPSPPRTRPQSPRQNLFPNLIPNSKPQSPWNSRRRIGQRRRIINRPRGRPLNPSPPLPKPTNPRSRTVTPDTNTDQINVLLPVSSTTSPAILLTTTDQIKATPNGVSLDPVFPPLSNIPTSKSSAHSVTPSPSHTNAYTDMMTHSDRTTDTEEMSLFNRPAPTRSVIAISETRVPHTHSSTPTRHTQTLSQTVSGQHVDRDPVKHSEEAHSSTTRSSVASSVPSASTTTTVKNTTTSSTALRGALSTSYADSTESTSTTNMPTQRTPSATTTITPLTPTMSATTADVIPTSSTTRYTTTAPTSTAPIITTPIPTSTTTTITTPIPTSTTLTTTTTIPTSTTLPTTTVFPTSTAPTTTSTISTTTFSSTTHISSTVSSTTDSFYDIPGTPDLPSTSTTESTTMPTSSSTPTSVSTSTSTTTATPSSTTTTTISAKNPPAIARAATPSTVSIATTTTASTTTKASTRQRPRTGQVDPRWRLVPGAPNQSRPPTDWKNPAANSIPDSHSSRSHWSSPPASPPVVPGAPNVRSRPRIADPHIRTVSFPVEGTARLTCEAQGEPKPSITWTKVATGAVMSIHSRAQRFEVLANGTLVIQNVQLQDKGTYICSAQSSLGRDRLLTTLEVWTRPPRMQIASYRETTIHQGGGMHLECQAEGVPTPLLSWVLPNRSVVTSTAPSTGRISMDTNGTLHIPVTLPSDRGLYRCVASNSAGASSASVRVHMSSLPPVMQQPREEHLLLSPGRPVYAHCSARGAPPPTLRWRIPDGTLVRPSQFLHGNLFVLPNGTLHIRSAGPKDSGSYECTASNVVGADKRTVRVEIKGGAEEVRKQGEATNKGARIVATEKPSPSYSLIKDKTLTIPSLPSGPFTSSKSSAPPHSDISSTLQLTPSSSHSSNSSPKINTTVSASPTHPTNINKTKPSSLSPLSTVPTNKTKVTPTTNSTRVISSSPTDRRPSAVLHPLPVSPFTKARIVSTSPSISAVHYGEILQLHCSVTGNPAPIIIWRTPSRKLVDMHFSFDRHLKVHPNGTLSVQAVTEKDAGDYLCIARNKVADDYRLLRVSVATKPAKIEPKQPLNQMVSFGKPLKVDCQASGLPDPDVRWSLPDGTMVNSVLYGEDRAGRARRLTVFDNGTLLVPAVGMGEEGEYTCYAENQGGQDTMKVKVKVMNTSPPTFTDNRSYHVIKVRQGATATIPCPAAGDPAPTVTWFSPAHRVIPQSLGSGYYSQRVVVVSHGTLEVRLAQKIDAGNYTCRASNSAGERRKVVGLEVEAPTSGYSGQVGGRAWSINNGPGSNLGTRSRDNINNGGIIQYGFTRGITNKLGSNNGSSSSYSHNNGVIRNIVPNTGVNLAASGSNPGPRSGSQNGFNKPVSGITTQLGSSVISVGVSGPRNVGIKADNTVVNRNGPGILSSSSNGVGNSHSTVRVDGVERNPGTNNNNEVSVGRASNDAKTNRDHGGFSSITRNAGASTSTFRGNSRSSNLGGVDDSRRSSAGSSSNTGAKNFTNAVVGVVRTVKQRAVKGQTVLLPCPSHGSPPPRLAWLLPGNGMLPAPYYGSRLTVHRNGSLELRGVRASDAGTLICVVKSDREEITIKVELEVSEPQEEARSPHRVPVVERPAQKIAAVPNTLDSAQSLSSRPGSHVLFHSRVPVTEKPLQRALSVPASPRPVGPPPLQPVVSTRAANLVSIINGETLRLPCPAPQTPGYTRGSLSWTMPSGKVLSRGESGDSGRYFVQEDGALTVQQASVFDRGTYTCRSSSYDSSSVSVVTVPVIVIAYPPRITTGPSPVTYTRPGVAVELPCLTIATPRATVTWETPDLTQLRVMGQPRIYGNRYLSPQGSLVIQNPTSRDTGFYRCTAKNVIGVDTKATYLHVI